MGAKNIDDNDLTGLGITIEEKRASGNRTLNIPSDKLTQYIELIKNKLDNGFWNEVIGEKEIVFVFKFKDGSIKEYTLSPKNEKEINDLCIEFNNEPPDLTPNIYKYISDNDFYRDFMIEHYADLINRKLWHDPQIFHTKWRRLIASSTLSAYEKDPSSFS